MDNIDSFSLICKAIQDSLKLTPSVSLTLDTPLRNSLVVNSIDFLKIFSFMEDVLDMDLVDDAAESTVATISTLVEYINQQRSLNTNK